MKVASPWRFGPIRAHLVNCSDGLLCLQNNGKLREKIPEGGKL